MPLSPPKVECVFCGCDRLAALYEPLELGAVIICGRCASLHILVGPGDAPSLRTLTRQESFEAHQDPMVQVFLDAYRSVDVEERFKAGAKKPDAKAPRPDQRVRHGDIVRLEARGPGA